MLRLALILFALALVRAEKPSLEAIYPAGGAPASTNTVTVSGKFEPWPPQVWAHAPGLEFIAQTNKGTFEIRIAADAKPGPRLIRLFNNEGVSEPQFFVIGNEPELSEAEPNDHFERPQTLEQLPVTINGRLDKNGDVDSFLIQLKAGQWLDAKIDSYTMMRSLDPILRLVDTSGHQLAFNHDSATLDPRLVWQAGSDQTVVLQVFGFIYPANSSVNLSGGPNAVYRLHLSATNILPAEIRAELSETEPNNSLEQAQALAIPNSASACISDAQDEDRFAFSVKKGEIVEFAVSAASLGSPLDAQLRLENPDGKELARNDDAENTRDPKLEWTAPEDGRFIVAISSLTHRGGTGYRYTLAARQLQPAFEASLAAHAIEVKAGETNELTLKIKMLHGFTNQLAVAFRDLPEGVSAGPVEIPGKGGDIAIPLKAETNAPAASRPITIQVRDGTNTTSVPFSLVSRSTNNGVPGGYTSLLIESTDAIWLTVHPRPPEPAPKPPEETVAGK